MTVTRLFPILRTTDLPRLVTFYERAFSASVDYRYEHEGRDVYVALAVGGGSIGIGHEPDVSPGDPVAIWLYVDEVDSAYSRATDAGAAPVAAPDDMPWGERVAQVRDPDGTLLYLGSAV
ncbi:VOC family protein [Microbacterium murale]|uniref:Extradiol dioxygenase n=1 Tax=Microbacterium murale TaxID=1081040 RepID=A0ABQ1RKN2_9MICO|nr:VOC family protein [Microbacterium murale]GGD73749.1 extradiol dioxygenase [Microbacterium murale]